MRSTLPPELCRLVAMAQSIITQFRQLIRTLNYVVSTYAAEAFDDDNLTILDLENIILTAKLSNVSATPKPVKSSALFQAKLASRSSALRPKPSSKSASVASLSSSLHTSVEKKCAHCGSGGLQLKHVTRSFGKGAALLVIESIPMWSCPSCGESYFTAQTMHEIERIKALRKSVAVSRQLPVAAFALA